MSRSRHATRRLSRLLSALEADQAALAGLAAQLSGQDTALSELRTALVGLGGRLEAFERQPAPSAWQFLADGDARTDAWSAGFADKCPSDPAPAWHKSTGDQAETRALCYAGADGPRASV